jgi:DNA-directed RNA polymerase subunit RPC12/RpoP
MSIKFACPRCKHSLRVPEQLAGKKAKCPHCSSHVGVPANGAAKAAVVPASSVAAAKHNPKVEFAGLQLQVQSPTGGGKPYKKQRGNPVMKLMYLTLALFLLGGGAFAAVKFNWVDPGALMVKMGLKKAPTTEVAGDVPDTKPKDGTARTGGTTQPGTTAARDPALPPLVESHFFPDGTLAIASVSLDAVLNSKLYDKAKEELAKQDTAPEKLFDASLKPYIGVQLTAASRVTIAVVSQEDWVLVVRPRNPVTIDEVKLNKKGDYKEVKIGRFTMYEAATDAYCLAEDQLLVGGPPAVLKKVLERNKLPELRPELESAYRLMNPAKAVSVAMLAQVGAQVNELVAKAGVPVPKSPELEKAGDQTKTLVLQLDLAQGLEVSATLLCKDADAATAVKKAVDGAVAMGKMKLETLAKESTEEKDVARAKKGEELLGQVKVAAEGANLTVSLALNAEMVTQLLEMLSGKQ